MNYRFVPDQAEASGGVRPMPRRVQQFRKRLPPNTLLKVTAVLISAMLGLTVTDRFGFERSDLVNATNILRSVVIVGMAMALVWFSATRRIVVFDIPCAILSSFYLYQLVPIALTWSEYSGSAHIRQVYSLVEWLIMIWTCTAILNFNRPGEFKYACLMVREFLKLLSVYTLGFLMVVGAYNHSLLFFDSITTFGGYAIHPNKLSILCALGILAWLDDRKARFGLLISIVLVGVAAMTGSRSGTGASLLAFGYGLIGRLPAQLRLFLYFILVPSLIFLILVLLGEDQGLTSAVTTSRLTDLNSRNFIWRAAERMYLERPVFGWGWFEGPARIGTYVHKSWFNARNAQNDFLNIQIASGIFATIFTALIYLRSFFTGLKTETQMTNRILLGAVVVIFLSALVEPILSTRASSVGMAFIIVCLAAGRHPLLALQSPHAVPGTRMVPTRGPALS